MSSHDLNLIGTQTFPNFRADLNNALDAIATLHDQDASSPLVQKKNQLWFKGSEDKLYISNDNADGWVPLLTVNQSTDLASNVMRNTAPDGTVGAPSYTFASDTDTGLYKYGANSIGVGCGGSLSHVFSTNTFTVRGSTPTLIIQDSDSTGNAQSGFISFRESANAEVGYIGYQNTADDLLITNTWTGGEIKFTTNSNTSLTVKGASVDTSVNLNVTGDITATGNVTAYSDERLKSNVLQIENALDIVDKLRGVSYMKDNKAGIGVIAQEIQDVLPEVVVDGGEYLAVAYGNIVAVLIEAVKELRAEVDQLKKG